MQHPLIMRNFLLIISVGFGIIPIPQQCIFLTFQFLFDANKPLRIFILKKFLNGTKLVQISLKRKILQTTIILPLEEWIFLFIYITSGKGLYECIAWREQGVILWHIFSSSLQSMQMSPILHICQWPYFDNKMKGRL